MLTGETELVGMATKVGVKDAPISIEIPRNQGHPAVMIAQSRSFDLVTRAEPSGQIF